MPPWTRRLVYLLFLLSGGTALVYQVTWVRDLSLVFGASFQATSIVLASFMAGLALGGFCLGWFAGRLRRPLAVYAGLELGVAAFALALPTLLRGVDGLYVAAALEAGGGDASAQSTAHATGLRGPGRSHVLHGRDAARAHPAHGVESR